MQDYQQIDIEIANRDAEIERYKNEREALMAQRAEIAKAELADAVTKVNALGGFATMEPQKKSSTPRAPSTGPKKYRDPATGAEWSGQGSGPEWILNQDKEQFLNPTWLAAKAAKAVKAKAPSQGAMTPSTPEVPAADQNAIGAHPQSSPASAESEPEQPASITLVDSTASLAAEVDAAPTSNVAPIVAATSSPSISLPDDAQQPVNPVVNPVAAQAA